MNDAPDPPPSPRLSAEGLRRMMTRLRAALNAPGGGRLSAIVTLVAEAMRAEVCSIYLTRGGALELFATEGLRKSAIYRARLRMGEGLVGVIARDAAPLSVSDAFAHPDFRYLPETGEEAFLSFHGAPILRRGRCVGVLVAQHRDAVSYHDADMEALSLIAAVIAEMAEANALVGGERPSDPEAPFHVECAAAAEGAAIGQAAPHDPAVLLPNPISDDPERETERLRAAVAAMQADIDRMLDTPALSGEGEHRQVLETYRLYAHDKAWIRRMEAAAESGLTAEAAVDRAAAELRARLRRTDDPYLRERLSDLTDIAARLLGRLTGRGATVDMLPENAILIARSLGPGELLQYPAGAIKGIALEHGSPGSHAAIIARALCIPMVTGAKGAAQAAQRGDVVIINGDQGRLHIRPREDIVSAYGEKLALREQALAQYRALRDRPAVSRDGARVRLFINAGLSSDVKAMAEIGAEGIGLWRTELQFLANPHVPGRDSQARFYRQILEDAGEREVVFRTLDIGSDKVAPTGDRRREPNPALGWRGVRMGLDRPSLLRAQLQALLRASNGRRLSVMFPMVAEPSEFRRAKGLLVSERDRMVAAGRIPETSLRVGAMLETPALAFASNAFYASADFISIGGNDLLQFFYAADRMNDRVSNRYDLLGPAFVRLLLHIAERCAAGGAALSFCGEAAGAPLTAIVLAATGVETLSMRPAAIGPVKRALLSVDLAHARAALIAALQEDRDPREAMMAFAAKEGAAL